VLVHLFESSLLVLFGFKFDESKSFASVVVSSHNICGFDSEFGKEVTELLVLKSEWEVGSEKSGS